MIDRVWGVGLILLEWERCPSRDMSLIQQSIYAMGSSDVRKRHPWRDRWFFFSCWGSVGNENKDKTGSGSAFAYRLWGVLDCPFFFAFGHLVCFTNLIAVSFLFPWTQRLSAVAIELDDSVCNNVAYNSLPCTIAIYKTSVTLARLRRHTGVGLWPRLGVKLRVYMDGWYPVFSHSVAEYLAKENYLKIFFVFFRFLHRPRLCPSWCGQERRRVSLSFSP